MDAALFNLPTINKMSALDNEQTHNSAHDLWKTVLSEIQLNLSAANFNTFFASSEGDRIEESTLYILCRDPYAIKNIEKKFLSYVATLVEKAAKRRLDIKLELKKSPSIQEGIGPLFNEQKQPETKRIEQLTTTPLQYQKQPFSVAPTPQNMPKTNLSSKFTFENYLMGKNNQLAFAIASAVANDPGKTYNPFFLYSGVGLGKTHLMQAIGNKIIEERSNTIIIYTTGEAFTNELIESIQSGRGRGKYTSNEFRDKYRKADVLLIDDIQFIAGKEGTQEEFFHTFNALYMAQKQIVVTSDRPPKDFSNLEDRIKSRFGSGIIADIQPPDTDMRAAILRNRRDKEQQQISNDVIDFIASKVSTNVRELEGAYLQVITYAKALGLPISIEIAAQALGQTIQSGPTKNINLNQILKSVCMYYDIKSPEIKGQKRTKGLVVPRQMAMYLMYTITSTPLMTIGEFLGGRDHTTIMHGIKKVEEEAEIRERVKQDISNITKMIYSE